MSPVRFQRDVFIESIFEAAVNDKDIVFISADFGAPALDLFRYELPDQFLHCGISEQAMVDIAGGLALAGKKVYLYAMAPFITLRCLEQTKTSLALMNLPVTIIAVGVGLGYADAGPTHYSTEDIACMRAVVGLEVWSPADDFASEALAKRTVLDPKLRLIRLDRSALPSIYKNAEEAAYPFKILRQGQEVAVLSYGYMLHKINNIVLKHELNCTVIDLACVSPICSGLLDVLRSHSRLVSAEEQCLSGGFGSAILEFLSDHRLTIPLARLGLTDSYFFQNGGRSFHLEQDGLSETAICSAIGQT